MAVLGAAFGIPITFVLLTLIFIGVGMNNGTAMLTAIWPSLVGGPFFGLLFTQTRSVTGTDQGGAPAPARARHKHGHEPHPTS
jgi:Na+-transporting NADH:ubiquinone oxidoreductase subunit NqrB